MSRFDDAVSHSYDSRDMTPEGRESPADTSNLHGNVDVAVTGGNSLVLVSVSTFNESSSVNVGQ